MYRSSGSSISVAKGSAALWLRRNPIEYVGSDAEKVEKLLEYRGNHKEN